MSADNGTEYRAEVVGEGLANILREDWRGSDVALWARAKLRKARECAVTGRTMQPGEMAYRPIGNQMYRYERIAADVIDKDT